MNTTTESNLLYQRVISQSWSAEFFHSEHGFIREKKQQKKNKVYQARAKIQGIRESKRNEMN